jgi:hypothetical protein
MSGVAEDPCQRVDEQADVAGMADTFVGATRDQPVPGVNRYQSAGPVAKHEDRPEPKRKRRAGSTLSLARGECDTRPRMAGGPAQRGCGWLYD